MGASEGVDFSTSRLRESDAAETTTAESSSSSVAAAAARFPSPGGDRNSTSSSSSYVPLPRRTVRDRIAAFEVSAAASASPPSSPPSVGGASSGEEVVRVPNKLKVGVGDRKVVIVEAVEVSDAESNVQSNAGAGVEFDSDAGAANEAEGGEEYEDEIGVKSDDVDDIGAKPEAKLGIESNDEVEAEIEVGTRAALRVEAGSVSCDKMGAESEYEGKRRSSSFSADVGDTAKDRSSHVHDAITTTAEMTLKTDTDNGDEGSCPPPPPSNGDEYSDDSSAECADCDHRSSCTYSFVATPEIVPIRDRLPPSASTSFLSDHSEEGRGNGKGNGNVAGKAKDDCVGNDDGDDDIKAKKRRVRNTIAFEAPNGERRRSSYESKDGSIVSAVSVENQSGKGQRSQSGSKGWSVAFGTRSGKGRHSSSESKTGTVSSADASGKSKNGTAALELSKDHSLSMPSASDDNAAGGKGRWRGSRHNQGRSPLPRKKKLAPTTVEQRRGNGDDADGYVCNESGPTHRLSGGSCGNDDGYGDGDIVDAPPGMRDENNAPDVCDDLEVDNYPSRMMPPPPPPPPSSSSSSSSPSQIEEEQPYPASTTLRSSLSNSVAAAPAYASILVSSAASTTSSTRHYLGHSMLAVAELIVYDEDDESTRTDQVHRLSRQVPSHERDTTGSTDAGMTAIPPLVPGSVIVAEPFDGEDQLRRLAEQNEELRRRLDERSRSNFVGNGGGGAGGGAVAKNQRCRYGDVCSFGRKRRGPILVALIIMLVGAGVIAALAATGRFGGGDEGTENSVIKSGRHVDPTGTEAANGDEDRYNTSPSAVPVSPSSSDATSLISQPTASPIVPGTPTSASSSSSSLAPSPLPTPSLTSMPTTNVHFLYERICEDLPNSCEDLTIEGSPQSKSLQWVASDVGFGLYPWWRRLQRYALGVLYYSLVGWDNVNVTNWMDNPDNECDWSWGSCDLYGRALTVDVNDGLSGIVLPRDVALLSSVEEMWLDAVGFNGTIPTEFGLLSQLRVLYLENNNLSGPVPKELGQLEKLEYLQLARNNLSGTVPDEVCSLRFVRVDTFYADCEEVECGCCTDCCVDGAECTYVSGR